jgi:hypothetical protein
VVAVVVVEGTGARLGAALDALEAQEARVLVAATGVAPRVSNAARRRGVAAARRRGMALALSMAPGAAAVLTCAGDGVLAAGTVQALRGALSLADAAFGRPLPDPREPGRLRPAERRLIRLLDRHKALSAEIAALREPRPWDPPARHGWTTVSLMAFRPRIYLAVGGLPALEVGAGAAMVAALDRIGARVARPRAAVILGEGPAVRALGMPRGTEAELARQIARIAARCAAQERALRRAYGGGPG